MKRIAPLLVLALTGFALAQAPGFEPSYMLECSGSPIDVGYYGSPCVVDWDGDDVQDLVLGQFSNGNIRFYQNEGTNADPVLNSFSYLQADGSNIAMGYG